jgi:hypothetical protein
LESLPEDLEVRQTEKINTEEPTVVSGQLEDSLRQEIESFLDGRLSAIKQEIASLQSQLNESFASLFERQSDVQLEGSLAASIAEHLRAAHESGIDLAMAESARAKASSDMAIVKSAITEINEQNSQAEILKVLVKSAASFAPRVAFFVTKGEQASGWRARGFEGTVGDRAIKEISLPLSADTVVGGAAKSLATWSGEPGSHVDDHLLLNRLGEENPQRVVAIPLAVRGRAVAVLYADSAGLDAESINLEALETLVGVSSMAVELLSASKAVPRRVVGETAPGPERAEPAYTPASEYEEAAPPAAEPVEAAPAPVEAVEAAPAVEPVEAPPIEPVAAESESSIGEDAGRISYLPEPESMAPIVEPALVEESIAAVESEPTPAVEEPPAWQPEPSPAPEMPAAAPAPAARRRYGQDIELPIEVSSDEERRYHNDARRFARLLIDEIKLYNEQKVAEGRSRYDLYDRLREYIDRSREMYDKRVKIEVSSRYDYFHDELVNKLAEGDVSKLGSNYPGATVNA